MYIYMYIHWSAAEQRLPYIYIYNHTHKRIYIYGYT